VEEGKLMLVQRRDKSHRRRLDRGAVAYLLRATFNADDQGYANAQVLDTAAEGILDGSGTVIEVDGTLAIVSNKLAYTAQSTPSWGDLAIHWLAITRALGRGLLLEITRGETDDPCNLGWNRNADASRNTCDIGVKFSDSATMIARISTTDSVLAAYTATTYSLALILGGYDSNGVPWQNGEAAAGYLYGGAIYVKGGAFSTWTLLWRSTTLNTATLYPNFTNLDATGTVDDIIVPDVDLSSVLQPTCLSTFTASDGTSLDAITPEVGGAWTEVQSDWLIKDNGVRPSTTGASPSYCFAYVDAGIADCIVDAKLFQANVSSGQPEGLALRASDDSNMWMVGIDDANNTFEISELNASVATERASIGITPAFPHNVRAILDGQSIDAFLDGGNKLSYGSAALNETATLHGLQNRSLQPQEVADNFAVYPRRSGVYDAEFDAV
jgi:hypothetical protein